MYELPATFSADASDSQENDTWNTSSTKEFRVGIPPVFGGSQDITSPEDFFALSIVNCYVATFRTVASRSDFTYQNISATCELVVDKHQGQLKITEIRLDVTIETEDTQRVKHIAQVAEKHCIIHNAIAEHIELSVHYN